MTEQGRGFELNKLEKQVKALEGMNKELKELGIIIKDSSKSSNRVATALNFLTLMLVIVGVVSAYIQHTY